jgi:type IV pilus assembly protein PilB
MGRLDAEQTRRIIESPEEMSGEAIEQLLSKEYGITEFIILAAKARACDMSPFNARAFVVGEKTFEKLDRDFCREHKVLPIGAVGDRLAIAISNPFNLAVVTLAQEQAG